MSDPISDSLKPRPDQRPSDERFPTPWEEWRAGLYRHILDSEGDAVIKIDGEEHYIKTSAMSFIVHRVNSFDTLLEVCRGALSEMRRTVAPRNSFTDAVDKLAEAIESAEKQP